MTFNTTFFIISSLTLPFFFITTFAKCHVDDHNGLLAFKSGITADPSGLLSSWKPTTDCCSWSGIGCNQNNRVWIISIYDLTNQPNRYLSGTISSSLSKLRYLNTLYLVNHRNLSGPFPDFLFKLPELTYVNLENTTLLGRIPDNIGSLTPLRVLNLVGTKISGHIPESISKLINLIQLQLRNNSLTGPVPEAICHLESLTSLDLSCNQLSGFIPDSFSSFKKLGFIDLSHNKLTGPIPTSISSLAPTLNFLELHHNSLTGKIPNFLGNFPALHSLDLSSNQFTGVVPESFANLTQIWHLNLSNNLLTDPFPTMYVEDIENLDLSNNAFHLVTIPKWLTSSPTMHSLKLAKCGIRINLDDWKPTETNYYNDIDLSNNQISGSPVWLLNKIDNLVSLKAANNTLKFDLEKLRIVNTLNELDLGKNEVFGKVTTDVVKVKNLNLSYNKLTGVIPPNNLTAGTFVGNIGLCGAPLPPCSS